MSDTPTPVDQPVQPVQEINEFGSGSMGGDHGSAVDAFNDMEGLRPENAGMDNLQDAFEGSDEFSDGENGFEGAFEDTGLKDEWGGENNENLPSDQIDSQEDADNQIDLSPGETQDFDMSPDNGSQSESASLDTSDFSINENGDLDAGEHAGDEAGLENNDQNLDEGNEETEAKNPTEQNNSKSKDQSQKQKGEWEINLKKDAQSIPGDNMLSRLARGEPTKEDLDKFEKELKKQREKAPSAVPNTSWLPKNEKGKSHSQPKESGPSKLAEFQKQAKAKEEKWNEIQSWNNKLVQRAEAQHEAMIDGLKK